MSAVREGLISSGKEMKQGSILHRKLRSWPLSPGLMKQSRLIRWPPKRSHQAHHRSEKPEKRLRSSTHHHQRNHDLRQGQFLASMCHHCRIPCLALSKKNSLIALFNSWWQSSFSTRHEANMPYPFFAKSLKRIRRPRLSSRQNLRL